MGNISTSYQGLTNYARQIEYIHLLFESPMEKKGRRKRRYYVKNYAQPEVLCAIYMCVMQAYA